MKGEVLTFSAAGALWAIPLGDVDEIISVETLRRVPLTPEIVVGLIDLRGTAVIAVDFAKLVGAPPTPLQSAIVVSGDGCALALLVDEVRDVIVADVEPRSTEPFVWTNGVAGNATLIDSALLLNDVAVPEEVPV